MIPWSQQFRCPSGHEFSEIVEKADKECPVQCQGEGCEEMAGPVFAVPSLMMRALPDGVRRPGFREAARASELEGQSYDLPPDKRGDINKEIKELRQSTTKGPKR